MSKTQSKRVFVAMSGGVDSSVAAYLLKTGLPAGPETLDESPEDSNRSRQGYDVTGVFMRCFNLDGCSERDAEDARRVAEHIGIPFYVFDFEEEYKRDVVEYMVDGYKRGITPNPDVMCNKYIKFGLFLKRALALGADYIATGHYVRTKNGKLYEAKDKNKDQSYFLWTLTQNELKYCLFPIGDYTKPQIREIAKKAGLPTAEKKDSQGVCFLGKVSVHNFLKQYIPETSGEVVTTEGKKIGEHEGAQFYTIGQRHIGVANRGLTRLPAACLPAGRKLPAQAGNECRPTRKSDSKPFYVTEKNIKTNTVIVAEGDENPALFKKEITLRNINIINPQHSHILQNVRMSVLARVRYRQPLQKATLIISNKQLVKGKRKLLHPLRQPANSGRQAITNYQLLFTIPVKFVAPGQSAVFYKKNGELLGGGTIE